MRAAADDDGDRERRLMASILDDAVSVYRTQVHEEVPSPLFLAIRLWVEDTDRTYRFSFESVCAALALEPAGVREQLRSLRPPDDTTSAAKATAERPARDGAAEPPVPDDARDHGLGAAIGANVRRHREARGLAVDALARDSGLAAQDLTAIEAGDGAPGLRVAWQLAVALGVPFGALLEHAPSPAPADATFRVQRAGEGRQISSAQGLRSRVLFGDGDPHEAELYELTLGPGAVDDAAAHAPGTFEHVIVTRGTLVIHAGEQEARLAARDAILFRADRPHRYANPGSDEVQAVLVMVYP